VGVWDFCVSRVKGEEVKTKASSTSLEAFAAGKDGFCGIVIVARGLSVTVSYATILE
jgi:hypothetical protein